MMPPSEVKRLRELCDAATGAFADALESAYRAGLERAWEIVNSVDVDFRPAGASEYGTRLFVDRIADAIRKEAGNG